MVDSPRGTVPVTTCWRERRSEAQEPAMSLPKGPRREAGSARSVEQRREPACLRANAPLVQLPYKWDERDPLDSWEEEEMLHPSLM